MSDLPDLNDPRLLVEGEPSYEIDSNPIEFDETEAELQKLAGLDPDVDPSRYHAAKAKLERVLALRALASLRGPMSSSVKSRFDRAQREADCEVKIALFSCRAQGFNPENVSEADALRQ